MDKLKKSNFATNLRNEAVAKLKEQRELRMKFERLKLNNYHDEVNIKANEEAQRLIMEEMKYYENLDMKNVEHDDIQEEERLKRKEESMIEAHRKRMWEKAPLRHKLRIKFKEEKEFINPRNLMDTLRAANARLEAEEYYEPPQKVKKKFLDLVIEKI
jgi:hypothetical protein